MPSTGTPSSNTHRGARGVAASVTVSGPPERITPFGLKARIAASLMSNGCSSQYTPASRTRRAMSWVYWEPKSRIRMRKKKKTVMVCPRWANNSKDSPNETTAHEAHVAPHAPKSIIDAVIRRFARNGHGVHMALTHARAGHAHEHGLGAHLVDVPATGVTHARAQTAHELVDDGDHRALVRHASLDALRHELLDLDLAFLEVAVAGAALHGTE